MTGFLKLEYSVDSRRGSTLVAGGGIAIGAERGDLVDAGGLFAFRRAHAQRRFALMQASIGAR
jgi:hypothetical protein